MSLTVAPSVNLETLRGLRADKQYFLSSTTGQIKEASIWMRMKCAIGLSSARQKVSNLVDAVRTSLLESAGLGKNAALDEEIRAIDMKHMVEGGVLKGIASRFSSTNANGVAKTSAREIISKQASQTALSLMNIHIDFGERKALTKVIKHALTPLLESQLPMMNTDDGGSILDSSEFAGSLRNAIENIKTLLVDISNKTSCGAIDDLYADHIIKTLFDKNGNRNENTLDDLKTKNQVLVDAAFRLNLVETDTRPQSVYRDLVKMKIDVEAKVSEILGFCKGDKLLEKVALEIMTPLCVTSNDNLRTNDTIKEKLAKLSDNIREIVELQKNFPGSVKTLFTSLIVLGGDSFPKGLLTKMANVINGCKFDKLSKLNSFSTYDEIYEGLEELRLNINKVDEKLDIAKQFNDWGGPIFTAWKTAAMAFSLAKLGPGFTARLPSIMTGSQYSTMLGVMQELETRLNNTEDDLMETNDKRIEAHNVLREQDYFRLLLENIVEESREKSLDIKATDSNQIDLMADGVGYMRAILTDAKLSATTNAEQKNPLLPK